MGDGAGCTLEEGALIRMGIDSLLAKHKSAVVKAWFKKVVDTYPADTSRFLKSQKDPFANPVGAATRKGLEGLMDGLHQELNLESAESFLDPIIRIRAIQTFTPSQAVGFIPSLKDILRETLLKEAVKTGSIQEYLQLESRIDQLLLVAFNIYISCREKVFELKANETRNRMFKAFERAGLVTEIPENEPNL